MKRIVIVLMVMMSVFSSHASTYHVSTKGELLSALNNNKSEYKEIYLEADIDISGIGRLYSDNNDDKNGFWGVFDGQGHTLKNFTYKDTGKDYVALFGYSGRGLSYRATFRNLVIEDFEIRGNNYVAFLVANPKYTLFENIKVINHKSLYAYDEYCGAIAGKAADCVFKQCVVVGPSHIYADSLAGDASVGGICGYSEDCLFYRCVNQSNVYSRNQYTGGICGNLQDSSIHSCVNTGIVSSVGERRTGNDADSETGGLAGLACDCSIRNSIMTNRVYSKDDGNNSIVGVNLDESDTGYTYSVRNPNKFSNNYYVKYDYLEDNKTGQGIEESRLYSGEIAYLLNTQQNTNIWKQILVAGSTFPNPTLDDYDVHHNNLCDGSDDYSNIFNNIGSHAPNYNMFGVCEVCGAIGAIGDNQPISLSSALEMAKFAYAVNKGQDFWGHEIDLSKDIDFSTLPADSPYHFYGIGTADHPFSGTFEGNNHTISNLTIDKTWGEAGLFPDVKGTTSISNVVLDNTCVIRTNCYGAGGIVGVTRGNVTLHLSQCGFEGFISGGQNVASMLGAVFESTNHSSNITINRCYNAGTVNGDDLSAAICGYANDVVTVTDTWNAGTVTGNVSGMPFFRYTGSKTPTYTNCYDVNSQSKINKIKTDNVASGHLCYLLNGQVSGSETENSWYQKIGEDGHPMLTKRGDDVVYKYETWYCDTPGDKTVEYKNASDAINGTLHDYDNNGFCHRIEGEEHYQPASLEDDYWIINNMGNLYDVAKRVNSGEEQYDILLKNNLTDNHNVIIDNDLNPNNAKFRIWIPIGNSEHPFTKLFNGEQHTISGLYCKNPGESVGLFGYFGPGDNAWIANVGVIDSYFADATNGGAIVGSAADGAKTISIHHCFSSGIIADCRYSGGIVGNFNYNHSNYPEQAPVHGCYSTCKLKPWSTEKGEQYRGGIIGKSDNLTIAPDCYYLEDENLNVTGYGYAKSKLAFRLGEVCTLLLNDDNRWTQDISTDAVPKFGNGGVKYTRTVTPGNWASLVLPCKVASTDDVQLYTFGSMNVNNHILTLRPVESVPANTPCFFKTKGECTTASFAFIENGYVAPAKVQFNIEKQLSENITLYLHGTYEDTVVNPEGNPEDFANYFVAKNQLWWGEEAFTLPAFRGYISIFDVFGNYAPAKAISLMLDEDSETTQIGEIRDGKLNMFGDGKYLENGRIVIKKNNKNYNINGQKIK